MHRLLIVFFVSPLLCVSNCMYGQTYSPVTVNGFNCDVVADFPTVPLSTSIAMDLQNNVMYTQTMATFLSLSGGIVDNGTIVSGTRTYQLAPYNGNCALHVPIGSTLNLTLVTPAPYAKLSVLALSTEFYSNVNITAGFTDGTTISYGSFQIQDWFGGTGSVYSGYGRIYRVATFPYNMSGFPTDPRMYVVDLTIPCGSLNKNLQYLSFNTTSGGGVNCSAFIWALSAVPYQQTIIPAVTDVSCPFGSNGSIALNVTGTTGPYTYNWNSVPLQTTATATGLPAGTFICSITDANGCTTKDTSTVTQPLPIVVTPTASIDSICSGDSVQLSVSGLSALTWNPGGLNASTITVFPIVTTNYTVTGTDANGCTNSGSVSVVVNPGALVTSIPNPTHICAGDSVQLQASGASNFTWSPSTGLSSSTISNPQAHPAITTIYTVTGTNTGGCSSVATDTVFIFPTTVLVPTATPSTLCAGDSSVLIVAGLTSYNWSPGGQTLAAIKVAPVATTTFTVSGNDLNGCEAQGTVLVTINQHPLINITPLTPAICFGDSVLLQTSGASSYAWSPATGLTTTVGVSAYAHPTSTTAYVVTGTDVNGCTGTNSVNVVVNSLPVVTATSNPSSICIGGSSQLSATGLTNLTWTPGGTISSTINVTLNATTTYSVTGTDANGCTGSASTTVTVYPFPQADFSSSLLNGCEPLTVSFTDLSSNNTTGWNWQFGNNATSTAQNPTQTFATGTFNITLIASNAIGCKDTLTKPALLTVYPKPVAAFTVNPPFNSPVELNQATFNFTNNSSGAIKYFWNFGDTSTSVLINPVYTYPAIGNYSVTLVVTSSDGCTDSITNGELLIFQNNFVVIPSAFTPNHDGLNDVFAVPYNPNMKELQLLIYNRWGQLIFSSDNTTASWDGTYQGMTAPEGVYVYKASIVFVNGQIANMTGHVSLLR